MDPGPTISRPYTKHKWVSRMICSQAIVSARAQDPLRLPESMTIIKNRTDNLRFSFPLLYRKLFYNEISLFSMIKLSFFIAIGIIIIFILVAVLIPKLNQLAYAHTFTGNESASFLGVIKMIQAESSLIKTNLALNPALAQQHAKTVISIVNRNYTFGVLPDEV